MSTRDRVETLERALRDIETWSRAYPTTVFKEPTTHDWHVMAALLKAGGFTLDAFSASIIRDTMDDVGRIAREALAKAGST